MNLPCAGRYQYMHMVGGRHMHMHVGVHVHYPALSLHHSASPSFSQLPLPLPHSVTNPYIRHRRVTCLSAALCTPTSTISKQARFIHRPSSNDRTTKHRSLLHPHYADRRWHATPFFHAPPTSTTTTTTPHRFRHDNTKSQDGYQSNTDTSTSYSSSNGRGNEGTVDMSKNTNVPESENEKKSNAATGADPGEHRNTSSSEGESSNQRSGSGNDSGSDSKSSAGSVASVSSDVADAVLRSHTLPNVRDKGSLLVKQTAELFTTHGRADDRAKLLSDVDKHRNYGITDYRSPRHLLKLTYWKEFIKRFVQGSKQLYRNLKHARKLKLEAHDLGQPLSRRDQRFVHQAYRDLLIGLPWVAWLALPGVGYSAILLAHFFPRYLPTVYQTNEVVHAMRVESAQLRSVLLYGVQQAISHKMSHIDENEDATNNERELHQRFSKAYQLIDQCISSGKVYTSILTTNDVRFLCDTLIQYFTWVDFDHQHIRWLLRYSGHESMLNPILPKCVLIYKLNIYAMNLLVDDKRIRSEGGVKSLILQEVVTANYIRGLPWNPEQHTEEELRDILDEWVEFSKSYEVSQGALNDRDSSKVRDFIHNRLDSEEGGTVGPSTTTGKIEIDHDTPSLQMRQYTDGRTNREDERKAAEENDFKIMLPPTGCSLLRQQEYTNNRLLPIGLMHAGMFFGVHIDAHYQINLEKSEKANKPIVQT